MAFFVLNSRISIGNFRFSGVHEVVIKRSLHSYADTAVIKVPSVSVVQKGAIQADGTVKTKGEAVEVTTGHKFNYRDPVKIELGYNGEYRTEFEGFVKRANAAMPLEIECEGYIQPLRLNIDISKHYAKTSAKELLNLLTKGADGTPTGISVVMNDDLPLSNMLLNHANGEDIIKEIKKVTRGALTIFFITPKVLWCGLAYTAYEGNDGENPYGPHLDSTIANYRMGYNVVKDNGMKMRFIEGEPVQINLNNVNSAGLKISTASEAKYAKNKQTATVNNIQDVSSLTVMGNEIQFQKNYAGYEGVINGFLQPYASPGYSANIVDDRYPERDGLYIIESTEVSFGVTGARRRVEIGPKIGFKA